MRPHPHGKPSVVPAAGGWSAAFCLLLFAICNLLFGIRLSACPTAFPAQTDDAMRALLDCPAVKAAFEVLDRQYDQMIAEMVSLTEIPSPPFQEATRAKALEAKFKELGLKDVHTDPEGNVIGERPGVNAAAGGVLLLAAHLDTVFPPGTPIQVKKEGSRYAAPGIGDDTHGLAVLLALIRALDAAQIRTQGDIIFVGDVGEEGLGDLRGVRYLFGKSPLAQRVRYFISLDGTGDSEVTNAGVASRRYRVTFRGPGGHSYGAFGLVNPAFAMGNAVEKFSRLQVPRSPKTTFNVGVFGGGTSVNAIPHTVWMEVDMRSESPAELAKEEQQFLDIVKQAVEEENHTRSTESGAVSAEPQLVGDRKGGQTPPDSPIVQAAMAATRALGRTPALRFGSTDSNVPISLGVPAVTIGSGGLGGRAHSLDEWVNVDKPSNLPGMKRALALVLALVGL